MEKSAPRFALVQLESLVLNGFTTETKMDTKKNRHSWKERSFSNHHFETSSQFFKNPLFYGQILVWNQKFHQGHSEYFFWKWSDNDFWISERFPTGNPLEHSSPYKKSAAQFHQHLGCFFCFERNFLSIIFWGSFYGGEKKIPPENQETSHPHQAILWCFLAQNDGSWEVVTALWEKYWWQEVIYFQSNLLTFPIYQRDKWWISKSASSWELT